MQLQANLPSPVLALAAASPRGSRGAAWQTAGLAAVLALFTLALRLPDFGNPTYHVDEAFYLFAGQAMRDGALPYADVWDRKPAGLFALYALIPRVGAVYWYQAVAAVFAWGTALALALIAGRFANRFAACAAGVFYLALLGALAGGGGQSPVFYNLLVAVAALLVLRAALGEPGGKTANGAYAAMLLCGLALTFKPTALPEGVFLGGVLMLVNWRDHRSVRRMLFHGARLVLFAAVPTLLIWAYFAWQGHFGDYWFATMQSIFMTQAPLPGASTTRLIWLAHILWLPAIVSIGGLVVLCRRAGSGSQEQAVLSAFVGGWFISALAGFFLIPNFYDHYALPLATVVAVSSAALFDRRGTGPLLAVGAAAYLLLLGGFPAAQIERNTASRAGYAEATSIIARHLGGGCLFVYDVTPALYRPFSPCPANKFAFPEHLSNQREAGAIGAEPLAALRDVLDQHPSVIVMPAIPSVSTPNMATRRALEDELAKHYRKAGETTLSDVVGRQEIAVWARRP